MTAGRRPTRRSFLATASAASVLCPGALWPQDREAEGGIGGTGIVGVLTDFGSLIVGGARVETGSDTAFSDGYGPLRETDISVGHALTVEASGPPDALRAERVHVTYPLVGRVDGLSPDRRRLLINGADLRLERPALQPVRIGARVAVSGLWDGATVVASRVDPARETFDLVSGTVIRSGRDVRIGAVTVRGPGTANLADGNFASAVGLFVGAEQRLVVNRLTTNRFTGAAGPLRRLTVEGWLETTDAAPGYRVAGLGHSFTRDVNLSAYQNGRVLFRGQYDGLFQVAEALRLPEQTSARRSLLRQLSR